MRDLRFKAAALALGGSLALAAVAALAAVGTPPTPYGGPALQDSQWLLGIVGGSNFVYQSGVTAVGTNQATAVQLAANVYLQQVDTAGSGGATGVALPECYQGSQLVLINNTAYTFDVYPNVTNNSLTSAQDTINGGGSNAGTSTTITTYTSKTFSCAKNGNWYWK